MNEELKSSAAIAGEPSEAGLTRGGEVPERMSLRACTEANDTEETATMPERTIETITGEIKALRNQTLACVIEIGRRLKEAKAMLPHGEFGQWLEHKVDFSQSTANNFMKLFDAYGSAQSCLFGAEVNSQALENLSVTNALLLLAIPEDERENFAAENDVEHLSSRELDKLIKERDELKRQLDAEKENDEGAAIALAEAQEKADAAKKEAADAAERAEALKKELDELKSKPIDVAVQQPDPTETKAAIDVAVKKAVEAANKKAQAEKDKAVAAKAKELATVLKEKEAAEKKAAQAETDKASAERRRDEALKELEKTAKADAMSDEYVQQFKSLFETCQSILTKLDGLAEQAEAAGKPQLRAALRAVCGQYAGGGE